MLLIPIIVPMSSGSSGPWTMTETKGCIAIYLAFLVLWFLCLVYFMCVKKMKLTEVLLLDSISYFLLFVMNMICYTLTFMVIIVLLSVGIYSLM